MSGIKDVPVTIHRSQWEAMQNNVRRAEETAYQTQQRQRAAENALNAANERFNSLNQKLNREISGLSDEMKQMASEQNRRLREQAKSFNTEMSNLKVNLEAQIEKNRESLQNSIDNIQKSIQAKEDNRRKQAEFWVHQTETFLKDIEQYRYNLFAPKQFQKIKEDLKQANTDIQSGDPVLAINPARTAFKEVIELKEIVVNAEMEWSSCNQEFQKLLADTRSILNYRKDMDFTFSTEDGEENIKAEINYWTENALNGIEEKLAQIEKKAKLVDELPTDALRETTDELRNINAEMEVAENKARDFLLLSQSRAEIADKFGELLEGRGWTCEGCTYEGGEEEYKEKVHAKFRDIKGNEIVAVISPDENMTNNIELNFFNLDNDAEFRQMHLESIRNSLKEGGLDLGTPVCRKGYESKVSDNTALKDIKATAAKKMRTARH
jgi:hypothetical protein